jgi:hypothetical protein
MLKPDGKVDVVITLVLKSSKSPASTRAAVAQTKTNSDAAFFIWCLRMRR